MSTLPEGFKINNYIIQNRISAGSFGIVYRAYDANLNRIVALKECFNADVCKRDENYAVRPKYSDTQRQGYFQQDLDSFIKNEKLVTQVDCANVIKIYECFYANGTAYIAMEFLEGSTLNTVETINADEIIKLTEHMLYALSSIHNRDIYHRDIKPENIFCRTDNTYVLFDFGAARVISSTSIKNPTKVLTEGYCSPEQETEDYPIGPWSDIYSLGVVLYKCITNKLPTRAILRHVKDDTESLSKNEKYKSMYPQRLLESIDIALSVDPTHRFQSAKAWYDYLQNKSVESAKVSLKPTEVKPIHQKKVVYDDVPRKRPNILKRLKEIYNDPKQKTSLIISGLIVIGIIILGYNVTCYSFLFFILILPYLYKCLYQPKLKGVTIIYNNIEQMDAFFGKSKRPIMIGRMPKSNRDIKLDVNNLINGSTISREHCELLLKNERIYIRDLGSSNGTYINGVKLEKNVLSEVVETNVITLGKFNIKLKFLYK